MKDLIIKILADIDLSDEDKAAIIEQIVAASYGINRFITPGFYLHTGIDLETREITIELWYRNIDENGETMHGPTNFTNDQILEMMKQEYLSKKGMTKK